MQNDYGKKTKPNASRAAPKGITLKIADPIYTCQSSSKSQSRLSLGILTCMALGAFTFATGFTQSNRQQTDLANHSTEVTGSYGVDTQDDSKTIEGLRRELESTSRKLKDYQAQLFRSSHPKDLEKISGLGRLLAEKEKLNKQLSISLKELERERTALYRQISTLEVTSDALNSLLGTHRKDYESEMNALKEQLSTLTQSYNSDKQNLIAKVESYESEQKKLLKDLDLKHVSVNDLKSTLSSHNSCSESLLQEFNGLKERLKVAEKQHKEEAELQSLSFYEQLQTLELASATSQKSLASRNQNLTELVEKERLQSLHLHMDLESTQAVILAEENRFQQLQDSYTSSLAKLDDLSLKLSMVQEQHELVQNDLSSALLQEQNSKASMLEQLKEGKEFLEDKIARIDLLERELHQALSEYETQKSQSQTLEEKLMHSTRELADLRDFLEYQFTATEIEQEALRQYKTALAEEVSKSLELESQVVATGLQLSSSMDYTQEIESTLSALKQESASHQELMKQRDLVIEDHDEALAMVHRFYQSSLEGATAEVVELQLQIKAEQEKRSLLQEELEVAMAQQKQDSNQENTQLQQEIEHLTEELTNTKFKLVFNEQQIKQLSDVAALLQIKYSQEVKGFEEEIEAKQQEALAYQEHLGALAVKVSEEGERSALLEDQLRETTFDLKEREDKLNHLATSHTSLENQRASLQEHLEELSILLNQKETLLEETKQKLAFAKDAKHPEAERLASLEENLVETELEKESLVTLLKEREAELSILKETLSHEIDRLQADVEEHQNQSIALEEHVQTLTSKYSEESNLREQQENLIHELTLLLQENEEKLALAKEVAEPVQKRLQLLQSDLDQLRQKNESLEFLSAVREADLGVQQLALANENERLEQDLGTHRTGSTILEKHLQRILTKHADESDLRAQHEDTIQELSQSLEESRLSLAVADEAKGPMQARLESLQSELDLLKQQNESLESLSALREAELSVQQVTLAHEIEQLELELAAHRAGSMTLESEFQVIAQKHADESLLRAQNEEIIYDLSVLLEEKEQALLLVEETKEPLQARLESLQSNFDLLKQQNELLESSSALREAELSMQQVALVHEIDQLEEDLKTHYRGAVVLEKHLKRVVTINADESDLRAQHEETIQELSEALEEKKLALVLAEEANEPLQIRLESFQNDLELLMQKNESLESSSTFREAELSLQQLALAQEIEQLEQNLEAQKRKSTTIENDLQAIAIKHTNESDLRAQHEETIQELSLSLQKRDQALLLAEKTKEPMQERLISLQSDLDLLRQQNELLESSSAIREAELSLQQVALAREIAQLELDLGTHRKGSTILEKHLKKMTTKQADLSELRTQHEETIHDLSLSLEEKELALTIAEAEQNALQNQLEALKGNLEHTEQTYSSRETKLLDQQSSLNRNIDSLQAAVREDREKIAAMVYHIYEFSIIDDEYNKREKELKAQLDMAVRFAMNHESSLKEAISLSSHLKNENAQLKQQATVARELPRQALSLLDDEVSSELSLQIQELRRRAEKSEAILNDWYTAANEAKRVNEQLQSENERLVNEIRSLKATALTN